MANTIKIKNSATALAVPGSLVAGELALNRADGLLYYTNSSGAVASLSAKSGVNAKLDELTTFNGVLVTFALTSGGAAVTPASASSLLVSMNGVIQEPLVDFTVSGSNITFTDAPAVGDAFFGVHMTGSSGATGPTGATGSSATATTSASDLTSGTLAAARLPAASTSAVGGVRLATTAETIASTSSTIAVTPAGLGLSTRGGGRAKFWEAFTDFNFDYSGNGTGSDGFSFGTYFIGTGASLDLYSNRPTNFASQPTAGIATLTTGTTATGSSSFYSFQSEMPRLDNGTRVYETLIYIPTLSTAVEEYLIRIGYVTGGPIGGAAIMVAFEYNRLNSVNWMAVTADNGTFTRTDTGIAVAATTWLKLAFSGNSTSIAFSIAGSVVATNTTNIRADGSMKLGGNILKSAGTTARTFLCDYVYTRHDFTGSR